MLTVVTRARVPRPTHPHVHIAHNVPCRLYNRPLTPLDRIRVAGLYNGMEQLQTHLTGVHADEAPRSNVGGSGSSCGGGADDEPHVWSIDELGHGAWHSNGSKSSSNGSGGTDDDLRVLSIEELGHEARVAALGLNAYGEEAQDLVLTLARAGWHAGTSGSAGASGSAGTSGSAGASGGASRLASPTGDAGTGATVCVTDAADGADVADLADTADVGSVASAACATRPVFNGHLGLWTDFAMLNHRY